MLIPEETTRVTECRGPGRDLERRPLARRRKTRARQTTAFRAAQILDNRESRLSKGSRGVHCVVFFFILFFQVKSRGLFKQRSEIREISIRGRTVYPSVLRP